MNNLPPEPRRSFNRAYHFAIGLLLAVVGLRAQIAQDPVMHLDKLVVNAGLLTASPATVSRIEIDEGPRAESSIEKLSQRSANFFASTNDAQSFNDTFALRGLTNTPIFGDPAVSFYLDNLPLGSGFTFPSDLGGFAAAELHRGPGQNTVYGRAGSAGVITLITPEPLAAASGELRASFGSYNASRVDASYLSAADGVADVYVNASHFNRNGYITNTTLQRDIDYKNKLSGIARFRVRPVSTAEFTLLVTALRSRDGAQPLVPLGGSFFTVTRKSEGVTDLDSYNAALTGAFETPIGKLTATTSITDWNLGPYNSVLAFGPSELNNLVDQEQQNWNEEIKLTSDPRSALRWQIGAFYSAGSTQGSFTRLFGAFPYEKSLYHLNAHDSAAFGESTVQLSPSVALTAGLRVEDSSKAMFRQEFVPSPHISDLHRESTALLPKVGVNYRLDSNTTLFASIGAGFKPGGFSAFTGNAALAAFGPERTTTFEAGTIWDSPDKIFRSVVRVFYYDITGYQIERSFATSSATDDYLVVNAARARSLGGEFELAWQPLAGLALAMSVGATDVTLREFRDPYTGTNFAGNAAPYVPVYDANLRVDYQHRSGWLGGIEFGVTGRTFYTEAEDLAFGQKSYALLAAHFGYAAGRYEVTAYGDNLTDRRYYSAITAGTGHGTPGAPRSYGAEVRYKF